MNRVLEKIAKNKTLINGSLFSIFSLFKQGISFFLLILLANYIAPAEYGLLSLFGTFVMFLGYFVVLSADGYVSISFFKGEDKDFAKDVSTVLFILSTLSFLLLAIVVIGGRPLSLLLKLPTYLLVIAVLVSFFQVVFNIILNLRRVQENLKSYGILSCGFAVMNFALSLVLVISFDLNWLGRVYAQFASLVLFGLIGLWALWKAHLYTKQISLDRIKKIAFWGIPLIPHLATTWIRQGCDRYIVDYYHSIEAVGLFSFALNLSAIIEVIGSSFNSTSSVSIYQILSDSNMSIQDKKLKLRKLTLEMFVVFTTITVCLVTGFYFFVPFFLPNYENSLPYFLILSIYGLLRCIYFIKCNYLFYWNRNQYLMYITITSSILHLLLSLALTRYSLYYTCIIYCISQIIIDVVLFRMSNRLIKTNLK